ncbi:hypothetical protein IFM89_034752 [Coptis chinensis]|uniref:Retrotransposon gag domain-containing protein n=1 Tax=Coptis chinensis TaxID=261450 RepID=A0A835HA63_9MAGN|nr:hypothetical protein IFM89_034752 [Coptis chinensis]
MVSGQWLNQSLGELTWRQFSTSLCKRFGSRKHIDPMSSLSKLTQQGTVREYITSFETLINLVPGIQDQHQVSLFVSGLKAEIQARVHIHNPLSLSHVKVAVSTTKKADPKAQVLKAAKAMKSGPSTLTKKAKKIRTSVTFHHPKTLNKARDPKYPRINATSMNKLDHYQILKSIPKRIDKSFFVKTEETLTLYEAMRFAIYEAMSFAEMLNGIKTLALGEGKRVEPKWQRVQSREVALKALNQISSSDASAKVLIEVGILPSLVKDLFTIGANQLPTQQKGSTFAPPQGQNLSVPTHPHLSNGSGSGTTQQSGPAPLQSNGVAPPATNHTRRNCSSLFQ